MDKPKASPVSIGDRVEVGFSPASEGRKQWRPGTIAEIGALILENVDNQDVFCYLVDLDDGSQHTTRVSKFAALRYHGLRKPS